MQQKKSAPPITPPSPLLVLLFLSQIGTRKSKDTHCLGNNVMKPISWLCEQVRWCGFFFSWCLTAFPSIYLCWREFKSGDFLWLISLHLVLCDHGIFGVIFSLPLVLKAALALLISLFSAYISIFMSDCRINKPRSYYASKKLRQGSGFSSGRIS